MSNQSVIVSLEALRTLRQQKYNPLRTFNPEKLASILEAWEIGSLREGAMLFETISDRDDTIKSVKPKREKEVSQLDRQFLALPGSGDAGDRHREVLEDFWTNVRTVNAYDRNERGGFRRLVKQMMTSVSFRYAAHHIVWRPSADRLRATFEFVPLWLFENRTGVLRYLSNPWATEGDLLDPGEWMVTHGDGLMIACSIGYLAKRSAFNDWLVFSEKFSVPGVLGRTSAKKDSDEGRAMRAAVESFGHDWTGVIYGDDGTHEKPIEIIQAAGNPSGMPMPAVVERVDRKFAALYRGADLSSMSSGPSGEGAGASLQGKEKDILLADDAETINETLAEVSRMVIEWYFGRGTEPLAKVELIVPGDEDEKFYLESVKSLKEMGVRVSKDAVLERLGVQEAAGEELALGETPSEDGGRGEDVANVMDNRALDEWLGEFRAALSADLQPLGDALAGALQESDLPAMQAALRKISERMPELAGDASELSQALAGRMADAFLGSDTEDVENGDFKGHPFRGNQWNRSARSWKKGDRPKGRGIPDSERKVGSIREVLDSAWNNPDSNDFVEYQKIDDAESEAIAERTGEKKRLAGTARTLRADDAIHVMIHSDDDTPVTERDVEDVARHLSDPLDQVWQKRANQAERLRSIVQTSKGELVIVEEEQTKNGRLALKSMHFKGKKTPPKP